MRSKHTQRKKPGAAFATTQHPTSQPTLPLLITPSCSPLVSSSPARTRQKSTPPLPTHPSISPTTPPIRIGQKIPILEGQRMQLSYKSFLSTSPLSPFPPRPPHLTFTFLLLYYPPVRSLRSLVLSLFSFSFSLPGVPPPHPTPPPLSSCSIHIILHLQRKKDIPSTTPAIPFTPSPSPYREPNTHTT